MRTNHSLNCERKILRDWNLQGFEALSLLSISHCEIMQIWVVEDQLRFSFVFGTTAPQWTRVSSFYRFIGHTQRSTTIGRNPLDEWSAFSPRPLTTQNVHSRQIFMPPVGFKPTVSAGELPQTARPPGPAKFTLLSTNKHYDYSWTVAL